MLWGDTIFSRKRFNYPVSGLVCAVIFLCVLLGPGKPVSGAVLSLEPGMDDISLGPYADILEDKNGSLNIQDVLNNKVKEGWFNSGNRILNFGFTDASVWLKVRIRNTETQPVSRLIEIAYPVLDYIRVFIVRNNTIDSSYLLGDQFPFSARSIKHRNFLIPLEFAPNETLDLVFKVRSTSSIQLPVFLMTTKAFMEKKQLRTLGYGVYYGIILAMVIYNLFVFISVKETAYLYYVFYILSMALLLSCLNGFSFQYLWPESMVWNNRSIAASISSVLLFAILFTRIFLDLPGEKPWMNRISIYLVVIWVIQLGFCLILEYKHVIHLVLVMALVMVFFALFAGIFRWIEGYTAARYYTLSWLIMLLGGAVLCLNKLGLVARNELTENTLQFGSAMEVLLLSFALADRLSTEKNIRFKAQQDALTNQKKLHLAQAKALRLEKEARLAQEEALAIQRKANENLEHNVRKRTRDLEIANERLQELSTTDSLTGLKNRRYFNEIYYKEYSRAMREQTPLSCLIMDIDRFKRINDTFGHLVGDECLKKIAYSIQLQLHRGNDFLARYGGEEFCVLLTNTKLDGAVQVAENIRSCVERIGFIVKDREVPITISIGVASDIPDQKTIPETLLNQADAALYQAKARGRNQVSIFGPGMG